MIPPPIPDDEPPVSPSSRTQVEPTSWLGRHFGPTAGIVSFVSGLIAWGGGMFKGLDPIESFNRLGLPVAMIVALICALAYTFVKYIPDRDAAAAASAERTRQLLIEAQAAEIREIVASHREDRTAWLSTQQAMQATLSELAASSARKNKLLEELVTRVGRLEVAMSEAPTQPGAEAHRPVAGAGGKVTGGHTTLRPLGGGRGV